MTTTATVNQRDPWYVEARNGAWFFGYAALLFFRWGWSPLFWNTEYQGHWKRHDRTDKLQFVLLCLVAVSCQTAGLLHSVLHVSNIWPPWFWFTGLTCIYGVATIFRVMLHHKYEPLPS